MSRVAIRPAGLTTLLFGLLLTPSVTPAQEWAVEAQAGRVRSALDPSGVNDATAMVGLRYDDLTTGLRLSAGIPTRSEVPLWGALSAAKRLEARTGAFFAGLDLAGHGFLLHDRVDRTIIEDGGLFGEPIQRPGTPISGFAAAGQILPGAGIQAGRVRAQVRGGVSHYKSDFAKQPFDRTALITDAEIGFTPTTAFRVTTTARRYAVEDSAWTYAGVTAIAAHERLSVWGTIGDWLNAESESMPWAAGAALRVHDRATITTSARNDALDPLYLTPPQTSWSLGASVRLGGRATRAAPIPAAYDNGVATIRLARSPASGTPKIAGDFTNWKPQPMQRAGDAWVYTARIAPGVYNYAFVNDKGEWFVPEKYPGRKPDGMGGFVAVLVVQQ